MHFPIDKLTSEEVKFINLHFFLNDLYLIVGATNN